MAFKTLCTLLWRSSAARGATQCVFGPDQLQLELPKAQTPGNFAARIFVVLCNQLRPGVNTSLWDLDTGVQNFLEGLLVISLFVKQTTSSDPPRGLWGATSD